MKDKEKHERISNVFLGGKKTLCIDWDGTICRWSFPGESEPFKEAIEAIKKLKEMGFTIVISSCRTSPGLNDGRTIKEQLELMKSYLEKYNIPFDYIDDGKQGKIVANAYIDDCGISISPEEKGKGWDYVLEECKRRFLK